MTDGHLYKKVMDFVRDIKETQEFKEYEELLESIPEEKLCDTKE